MRKGVLIFFVAVQLAANVNAKLFIVTRDAAVRRSRKAHAGTLGNLKKGDTVDAEQVNGTPWVKIQYKEKQGFIRAQHLQPMPVPVVVPAPPKNNPWTKQNILWGLVGCVVAFFVGRRIITEVQIALRRNKAKAYKPGVVEKPTHWYQCKQCRAAVKKHTPPSESGCINGMVHNWIELAEVGMNKYFCKHCATTIKAKAVPVMDGCPGNDYHYWTQLP